MDLDTLRFANFALLDDAVSDWSTLVDHLKDLERDAEDGLHKAATKANWAGYNAQVTKEFIGKTAGEFKDAHTQATTLHRILSDTRDELKAHHKALTAAIERGQKKNLTVRDTGHGTFTVTAGKGENIPDPKESDVTALRDEIQGILGKATESDDSAKHVLEAIVDQSRLGFSDAQYKDRDSAVAAVKAADDLAKLARKAPEDLTPQEFDRLNAGLKKYQNDSLFAERFATDLGPKKTLEFWAGLSDPAMAPDIARQRRDDLGELQKSLSMTLATASQSDTGAMTDWKRRMIDLGDHTVGNRGGVLGFQVMSNLMRAGDYDDAFMTDYGKGLMAAERKFTEDGETRAWTRLGADPFLNHMKGDSGSDPMTGYLKGLSNSPAAATEFFNDEFLPADGDRKHAVSNFTYLFEDRHWPHEINVDGDESNDGRNSLALALEAGTTGHPAGEILPPTELPAHNEGQTKLFESLASSISEDNERLTKNGYMSDSMGQIASEYLPDINRASMGVNPHPDVHDKSGLEAWDQVQKLFPVAGSSAELNHRDAARFLFAVGQNPDGYAAVELGQKSYMSNLMDYHLDPGLPANQRPFEDPELTVRAVAGRSGEVSGILAMGRNEACAGPADEKDEHYDHAVAQWKNVISGSIGTGIGVGSSFIASPVVGAGVGGVAGTVSSMILEEVFQGVEGDAKDNVGAQMGDNWENGRENNSKYTQDAAYEATKVHHHPHVGDVAYWAKDESSKAFLDAGEYMREVGPELVTDI